MAVLSLLDCLILLPHSGDPWHSAQHPLTDWVLYAFRHTFLTRLGESGCDAWTLARIAGHSSIAISSRYVHPIRTDATEVIISRVKQTGDIEASWKRAWMRVNC